MSAVAGSGENQVKKRNRFMSGIMSLLMGNGKLKILTALVSVTFIFHNFVFPFWDTGINIFITLGMLMFAAFIGGTFFKKWAFPLSSLLILIQLSTLFYINFEHMDFIREGKNVPTEYNWFMNTILGMIIIQLGILITSIAQSLRPKLFKINNWLVSSIFLLSTVLCGIAIGQVWVILSKLKCDC